MERATVLLSDFEHRLSESLKIMEKYGYGLSRQKLLNLV
jgi:hypothetical protein